MLRLTGFRTGSRNCPPVCCQFLADNSCRVALSRFDGIHAWCHAPTVQSNRGHAAFINIARQCEKQLSPSGQVLRHHSDSRKRRRGRFESGLTKRGNRDDLTDLLPGRTIDWRAKDSQSLMILDKRLARFEPVGTGTARRESRPALSRSCKQMRCGARYRQETRLRFNIHPPDRRADCERDRRSSKPSVCGAEARQNPDAERRHQMKGFQTCSTSPAIRNTLGIPGKVVGRSREQFIDGRI